MIDLGHQLQALHSRRRVGPPQQPCYAECVCGWVTDDGDYVTVRAAFFAHAGACAFPPRQT